MVLTEPIELDPVHSGADQDREILTIYRVGSFVAAAAGAGSWYMAADENLTTRERAFGRTGAAVTIGLGVAAVVSPVPLAAVLRRRLPPWLLPAFGLAVTATSGANRSPMFFPAVILSGLGGGRLGAFRWPRQTASGAMGLALGASYACLVLNARRPWRAGWDSDLLWNLGVLPAFIVAPLIGGEMGDLALSMRRLERSRARDQRALDAVGADGTGRRARRRLGRLRALLPKGTQRRTGRVAGESLPELVNRVQAVSHELENVLLRIATVPRAAEVMQEVNEAVEEIRRGIEHHRVGPTLVRAARSRPGEVMTELESVFSLYRSGWRQQGISLTVDTAGLPVDEWADARVTSVLVRATKIALDNAEEHGGEQLTAVSCSLTVDADQIVLRVTDDGGPKDELPDEASWGTGLTETAAEIRALGGDRPYLRHVDTGVEFVARLPRTPLPNNSDTTYDSVMERGNDALARCATYLMPSNYWAGVMGHLRAGRQGWRHAVAFSALVVIDRAWARRVPSGTRRAAVTTPAIALLWPSGGLPPGGWIGAELFFQAVQEPPLAAVGVSLAATSALALRSLQVRGTISRALLIENVLFSPFCAVAGLAPRYLRGQLRRVETETLSFRERAELVETLARATRLDHDVAKPLRSSSAWYEGIKNSADGQLLLKLSGDLDELVHGVLSNIEIADPLVDIQQHLQMRLDPVSVAITGRRPVDLAGSDNALQRARQYLATVALADQLADRLLHRFPPNLLGRSRLVEVQVDISPVDESHVRMLVRPRPSATSSDEDLRGLVSTLTSLDGAVEEGFEDGALSFTMAASAVAIR